MGLGTKPAPPPPPVGAPRGPSRERPQTGPAVVASSLAAVGWLIWIFGLLAEADTGHPDGLACTGNPAASDAYASCMENAERAGAMAWALTLGLAVAGLVALAHFRWSHSDAGARGLTVAATALSGLLATAGVIVWVQGARGEFFEDRIGSTTWNVANAAAVIIALTGTWLLTRGSGRDRTDEEAS